MNPEFIDPARAAAMIGDAFPFATVDHGGRLSTWRLPLGVEIEEDTAPWGGTSWRVRRPGRPARVLRSNQDLDTMLLSLLSELRRAKVA